MKSYNDATKSAKGWCDLLRKTAGSQHSMELSSSSLNDLADTLESLLDFCTKKAKQPSAQSAQGAKNAVA